VCNRTFLPLQKQWLTCWQPAAQSKEQDCLLLALAPDRRGTRLSAHCGLFWKVLFDLCFTTTASYSRTQALFWPMSQALGGPNTDVANKEWWEKAESKSLLNFHRLVFFMCPSHCHTYGVAMQVTPAVTFVYETLCKSQSLSQFWGCNFETSLFHSRKVMVQNNHGNFLFWHKSSLLLKRKTNITNISPPKRRKENGAGGCSTQSSPALKWKYLQRSMGRPCWCTSAKHATKPKHR